MPEQQYPEPIVGALIFNPEGKLLLVKSHKFNGMYVIPGGHIELGEKMEDALKREVKEETDLDIYNVKFIGFQEFIFDEIFHTKKHFIFFDYSCRTDSKPAEVKLNSEAQSYIWVPAEEALKLDVDPYTIVAIKKYLQGKRKKKD